MQCTIAASDIQVLYWPVETRTTRANDISTTTASTPFTLVSDGFSYISPSVYVIYRSLCANANIGLLDLSPDPGLAPSGGLAPFGTVYDTTIGYPPEALSTSHCFLDGWKAMNYYDIQHSHSYRACGETSPYFSFPVDITALDPAWSACKINSYGGLDPPRALDKAAGLISSLVKSTTTRLDPAIVTPLPAAPGSRPAQADAENDRYKDENKDPSHVVTYLAASFATTHQLSVAPKSDRAVSDSSSGVLVWNRSSSPSTPLLSSQALRIASADSNSPKSASTVSEGKHASPASLLSGSQQGLGKIDKPNNDSDVVAFMGGGSGKMNVMNKLCVAFMICMGFRAIAFTM
ncbi:MAG: hypothetical protein ASARMPREDX12_006395 [Alectoria sarmentosa]|nr:MAG: hypothetical protein ASARMPREDX12_006395 [Alectoria sarmentosa]